MKNSSVKSLLNQSAFYGLGIFLMKGISLVMLPVYTHYLSPTDYGRLEVLVIFSNVMSILIGFGLVEALYRFVGLVKERSKKESHAGECLLIAGGIGIVSYVFFVLFSGDIAGLLPDVINENEVYLLGIALSVGGLINIPLAWLRITERAYLFFKVTMLKVVLQVLLTLYWLSDGWGISSILAAGAVSSVTIAVILCIIQIRETGLSFSRKGLNNIICYAGPIFVGGIATFALSGMDRWILAKYFGATEIAAYAIAVKFALVPTLLIQPFTLWWFPKRFSLLKEENGIQQNAHFAIVGAILSILICGAVGLLGPFTIIWLTPLEYHQATKILPWVLLCTLSKMLAELLNLGCFVDKDSKVQMNINLVCCGLCAVLLLILIPSFTVFGALLALNVANFSRLLLLYYYSQKKIYLPYKFGYFSTALATAFLATILGQYNEGYLWLVAQ